MTILDMSITNLSVTKVFVHIMNVRRDILKLAEMENFVSSIFKMHIPVSIMLATNLKIKKIQSLLIR